MELLVIGRSVLDEYYETDHFPLPGEKVDFSACTLYAGGFSNGAFVAAALGTQVAIAETLGEDEITSFHLSKMEEAGISPQFIRTAPGYKNTKCMILRVTGDSEKTVFTFRSDPPAVLYTPSEIREMGSAAWVYASISDLKKYPLSFLDSLLSAGVKLALDADASTFASRADADIYFSRCDFISLNDFSFPKFCAREGDDAAVDYVSRKEGRILVHTMGERGCRLFTKDSCVTIPLFSVVPIDATGAGDTFNGAMLHKLIHGASPHEAAQFACAAAALSTTRIGGRGGMAGEEEVKRFIKEKIGD